MYPTLRKILPDETPNEDLIERREKEALKTVYQIDYSDDLGTSSSLKKKKLYFRTWII